MLSEHAPFELAQIRKTWFGSPITVKQPQMLSEHASFELAQICKTSLRWFGSPITIKQPQMLPEQASFKLAQVRKTCRGTLLLHSGFVN
jgi:hypothetical protein